jgi:predicted branched-subunit amino acid permease
MHTGLWIVVAKPATEGIGVAVSVLFIWIIVTVIDFDQKDEDESSAWSNVKIALTVFFLPLVLLHFFLGGRCRCGQCDACRWWEQ